MGIADYQEEAGGNTAAFPGAMLPPTADVWGTVAAATDATQKGNVCVKVAAMKDGSDTFENVPVLTVYGGGDCGVYFLPEEGDTVRLTFLSGDFLHPVVTGCRYRHDSRFAKDVWHKENLQKAVRVKNGSSVLFSGEKGKEKITVSGPKKLDWELDEEKEQISFGDKEEKNRLVLDKKNGKAVVKAEEEISLRCGKSTLVMKKDGTVELRCEKFRVEAKNAVVKGSSKTAVSGQELTLEGVTGLNINGKSQIKVDCKGQVKIAGAVINLN